MRQPAPEGRRDERREVDFYHDCKPRMDERVDEHHCSAVEGSVGASHPPPNPRDWKEDSRGMGMASLPRLQRDRVGFPVTTHHPLGLRPTWTG